MNAEPPPLPKLARPLPMLPIEGVAVPGSASEITEGVVVIPELATVWATDGAALGRPCAARKISPAFCKPDSAAVVAVVGIPCAARRTSPAFCKPALAPAGAPTVGAAEIPVTAGVVDPAAPRALPSSAPPYAPSPAMRPFLKLPVAKASAPPTANPAPVEVPKKPAALSPRNGANSGAKAINPIPATAGRIESRKLASIKPVLGFWGSCMPC